jgi:hypothetical protein
MESKKGIKEINPKPACGWSAKTAIIAGIVLFIFIGLFFLKAATAQAQGVLELWKQPYIVGPIIGATVSKKAEEVKEKVVGWVTNEALKIAQNMVNTIVSVVHHAARWAVMASAALMEAVLLMGFRNQLEIVKVGWKTTRDLANMFFVLFMVIVAFATILRIERYGIKQLLPKVIIIALLINFSYVICAVIVDFSNITARFFLNDIQDALGKGAITGGLADGLQLLKVDTPGPEDFPEVKPEQKAQLEEVSGEVRPISPWQEFLQFILSFSLGALVLLVAAFTFLAGAVLLIFRIIMIWFLLIFVPIVFICYILPGLRNIWQKWWSNFLKWCFFAPAYTFFLWLALKIVADRKLEKGIEEHVGEMVTGTKEGIVSAFALFPQYLLNFGFIIALLLGGLIAASKFGIYGASATMNIVQKGYRGASAWAKRTGMRPVKSVGTKVAAGAFAAGGLLPGRFGRRMKARAAQVRQRAEERVEHKKYRAVAERMSNKDLLKEARTALGVRRFIAAREAAKRGILREADRKTVRRAGQALHAFGAPEAKKKLEELRPDSIKLKHTQTRKEAIERSISEGTHKKWSKKVFKGLRGAEIAEETRKQLGTGEFGKIFKGWAKDVQQQAEKAMQASFTDNFTDPDNLKRRRHYASITGKVQKAFYGDQDGNIQKEYIKRAETPLRSHVSSLTDEDFGKLDSDKDRAITAIYMKPNQVAGAGTKLSGKAKETMKIVAKNKNPDAYEEMKRTKGWGGSNLVDLSGATPERRKEKTWQEAKEKIKKLEEEE